MRWSGFYFSWLIQFFKMPRGSNWPPWWFYCEYHDSFRSKPLMLVFKIQYPSLTIAVFCGGAVSLTVKHVVHRWVTLLSWHNYWTFPVDDSQPKQRCTFFLTVWQIHLIFKFGTLCSLQKIQWSTFFWRTVLMLTDTNKPQQTWWKLFGLSFCFSIILAGSTLSVAIPLLNCIKLHCFKSLHCSGSSCTVERPLRHTTIISVLLLEVINQ